MHVTCLIHASQGFLKSSRTGCPQDFLADEAKLRRRLVAAAAANLLLSPFLLMFLVIYFFMKHAEKFYHSPGGLVALASLYSRRA
jgi:autophagy-related protein 9